MKLFARASLAIALVMQASCRESKTREPVFPVRGTVLYQGRPAAGARVSFVPVEGGHRLRPQGACGPDGVFELSTYELNDGAPSGSYAVAIIWPGPNPRSNGAGDEELQGPDRLNGRFSNPEASAWRVEIDSAPLALDPFRLE